MLKNKSFGFYSGCVAVILGIAALGLYFTNISNAYFADSVSGTVVGCTIASVLMIVLYIGLRTPGRNNKVIEFCRGLMPVGAVFCIFAAFMTFLNSRVYNMAIIYGSSLEANNASAQSAMAQAIVTLALYLVAGIAIIVAAFNKVEKDE